MAQLLSLFQAPGFWLYILALYCRLTIAPGVTFPLALSRRSGRQLSLCVSFPAWPASEQILAWPYQRKPQRAEVEAERMLRGERLLGEAANDRPRWRSLTLGPGDAATALLWRKDSSTYCVISMLTGKSSPSTQTVWLPNSLQLKFMGEAVWWLRKWGWWLQGHRTRLGWERSELLPTWTITDFFTNIPDTEIIEPIKTFLKAEHWSSTIITHDTRLDH